MRFVRKTKRKSKGINVTPLIDLMFLLVIFILIAAQFEPDAGVSVTLPSGGIMGEATESLVWRMAITIEGDCFFEREKTSIAELRQRIEDVRRDALLRGYNHVLVVEADEGAPFGIVAQALAEARKAGQTQIRFSMMPE